MSPSRSTAAERRWAAVLGRLLAATEPRFDAVKYRLRSRGAARRRAVVVPYRGYGTREKVWVKGRVLLEPAIPEAAVGDPLWRNLLAAWRRFESDEVPGARLQVEAAGASVEVEADEEGYFEAWLELATPPAADVQRIPVRCELLWPERGERFQVEGEALVPPRTARLAVVSDVDDTVVPTGAGRLLQMARSVLLHNAHSRAPFPGVAALYRALASGRGVEGNPFLYVSSGPWNLYDLLVGAFRLHELPAGPLVLRDWGSPPPRSYPRATTTTSSPRFVRRWSCGRSCPSCSSATAASRTPRSIASSPSKIPGACMPSTSATSTATGCGRRPSASWLGT
jgi:phosphatidate phosphatase APP1